MSDKREIITERLNNVFCDVFDDETIKLKDKTTANDIEEWDSLTHIVLLVAVEKEFGLNLSASEVGELENVGGMINILEERATK